MTVYYVRLQYGGYVEGEYEAEDEDGAIAAAVEDASTRLPEIGNVEVRELTDAG